MNGEQRLGWYFAHAQDDLNPRILRMFEGIFSLDETQITEETFYEPSQWSQPDILC